MNIPEPITCPHCGGAANMFASHEANYSYARIDCRECPASMIVDTYEMPGAKLPELMQAVVERWNKRVNVEPEAEKEAADAQG